MPIKLFAAALLAFGLTACGQEQGGSARDPVPAEAEQDPAITDVWARPASLDGVTAAYFTVVGQEGGDRLLMASSDVARSVELHTHAEVDGTMQMRPISGVDVDGGEMVRFEPGGLHVMLIGLNRTLEEGDTFDLALRFEDVGDLTVRAEVRRTPPDQHDETGG